MRDFLINRLREPSTYAGLAGIAGAFGVAQPLYNAVSAVIMALAGLAAVILIEKPE